MTILYILRLIFTWLWIFQFTLITGHYIKSGRNTILTEEILIFSFLSATTALLILID